MRLNPLHLWSLPSSTPLPRGNVIDTSLEGSLQAKGGGKGADLDWNAAWDSREGMKLECLHGYMVVFKVSYLHIYTSFYSIAMINVTTTFAWLSTWPWMHYLEWASWRERKINYCANGAQQYCPTTHIISFHFPTISKQISNNISQVMEWSFPELCDNKTAHFHSMIVICRKKEHRWIGCIPFQLAGWTSASRHQSQALLLFHYKTLLMLNEMQCSWTQDKYINPF